MWRDLHPIGRDSRTGGYVRSPFASAERECAAWYAEEAARRAQDLDLERIAPSARVVVVDGDAYYSRPGPRLADGVRQLGHLLHPDAVADPGLPLIELTNVGLGVA